MIVSGASCTLVAEILAGPRLSCDVVVTSRTAVHARTGNDRLPLLSVERIGAARLPGSVILSSNLAEPAWDCIREADTLEVGAGAIAVGAGAVKIEVRRWWDRPPVRLPGTLGKLILATERLRLALAPMPGDLGGGGEMSGRTPTRVLGALVGSVGRGPGLTPEADDVLAGALTTWHRLAATGAFPEAADAVSAASTLVRPALGRTTAVSAALLQHAAYGRSVVELHALLDALRTPRLIDDRLGALARVGHSSGLALARGALLALRSATAAHPTGRLVA